ncbi:sensor histidine kinase [Bacillus mycoides]|uniref:sensor histidine kinase n=1 Tax=Bacillus TaxID=1386 RepID=UPI0019134A9B|nr:sensor histidine kinase [Bacillus sp. TH25]MBK5431547.1 hypothetical protein [Bacillus sp. TH25]
MADSSAVKRIIENLITNAIKHSSEEVTIQPNIMNPAKQLKEEEFPFLFDRFYKVDQAWRKKVQI